MTSKKAIDSASIVTSLIITGKKCVSVLVLFNDWYDIRNPIIHEFVRMIHAVNFMIHAI